MTCITKYGQAGSTSSAIEAVQVVVETLEANGVVFRVIGDDEMRVDLDGLGPPPPYADAISAALLALAEQIKSFLALRSVEGSHH
jgi:hypothetical protein